MFTMVNDITLSYEKVGQGQPILLLHGNGESRKIFDQVIPLLKKHNTVYAIDSRGHGESGTSENLDYLEMAKDIVAFIQKFQIEKPILYGFSDGGIIGLLIASQYPQLLSKLIISGANVNPNGLKTAYLIWYRFLYTITRNTKYHLMLTQPNISEKELGRITAETLVLAGSKDVIKESHTKYIAESIPNHTLRILPNETHYSYVVHSSKLYDIITSFL